MGGGPAGATAACLLAEAGRRVTLFERDSGPRDKICGEFLSHEAGRTLARLGIDPAALGASAIERVRLIGPGGIAEAALGFRAAGLSRRVLDEALLDRAAAGGVTLRRGVTVGQVATSDVMAGLDPAIHAVRTAPDAASAARNVGNPEWRHGVDHWVKPGDGVFEAKRGEPDRSGPVTTVTNRLTVRTSIGQQTCDTLLLATGKHDLRGARRRPRRAPADLVGFKTYFALAAAQRAELDGHVEVILLRGGYAGLQLVEGGRANLCLLVPRARVPERGWTGLLDELLNESAHLRRRLAGAAPLLARPVSIFRVPYGFVHRDGGDDPTRLFRLGDQMAVIPSFCGDGMAMALHTAAAASAAVLDGDGAATFHRAMARDLGGQVRLASAAQRIGQHRAGQAAMLATARHWPRALTAMAARTRAPGATAPS